MILQNFSGNTHWTRAGGALFGGSFSRFVKEALKKWSEKNCSATTLLIWWPPS
jgi:hypothetical protein